MVRAIDLAGRASDRYCQFVPTVAEVGEARGLRDLCNDRVKDGITGRERDAALDLYFEDGGIPNRVMGVNHNIVKRMSFGRSLKLDAIDCCSGQATWFRTCQQRQQIVSSDLALEVAAGRST